MNKLITKRIKTVFVFAIIFSSVSIAQFDNLDFLKGGAADGGKIIKAYVSPWVNAFGAGLSGGWYNTAKPHKFGGFDITSSFSVGIVPTSEGTYNVADLKLASFPGATGIASTISGPAKTGPTLTKTVSGITVASFSLPKGVNWNYIPVPALQIGLGLPLGTEVKVRYLPKINVEKNNISLWGVGLMHSIMQYIPGNKLSPFDISVFGGYTKLTGNVSMDLQPNYSIAVDNYSTGYLATKPFDNQNLNISVTAINVSAIASVKLSVITFYGGLGYSKTNTMMKLNGNFPVPVAVLTPVPRAEYNNVASSGSVIKGSDFTNMDFANDPKLRANIGFRLKLAVITIHADYTRAMYNVVSAGLGISFR
jgi:hypothetical protein